jgi:hypothetical protein
MSNFIITLRCERVAHMSLPAIDFLKELDVMD